MSVYHHFLFLSFIFPACPSSPPRERLHPCEISRPDRPLGSCASEPSSSSRSRAGRVCGRSGDRAQRRSRCPANRARQPTNQAPAKIQRPHQRSHLVLSTAGLSSSGAGREHRCLLPTELLPTTSSSLVAIPKRVFSGCSEPKLISLRLPPLLPLCFLAPTRAWLRWISRRQREVREGAGQQVRRGWVLRAATVEGTGGGGGTARSGSRRWKEGGTAPTVE
jgi:hypothetical protein